MSALLDVESKIIRLDILNYIGSRGRAVMNRSWLRQFIGKSAESDLGIGGCVDAVTGATISADAIAKSVKRRSLLVRYLDEQCNND